MCARWSEGGKEEQVAAPEPLGPMALPDWKGSRFGHRPRIKVAEPRPHHRKRCYLVGRSSSAVLLPSRFAAPKKAHMPFDELRPWLAVQAWLTILLVVILHMLYTFLHRRRFLLWWTWGWTAFVVLLATAWIALHIEEDTSPLKSALLFVGTLAGMLQAACFILGARELRKSVSRRTAVGILASAAFIGVVAFAIGARQSTAMAHYPLQQVPRELTLAGAYLYCAYALSRWSRETHSIGALIGAMAAPAYAVAQLTYLGAQLYSAFPTVPHAQALARSFMFDLASEVGIFVGTVLLFLEEHRSLKQRLDLYASVLPTCCQCGLVRDDTMAGREKGPWVPLADFVAQHSAAQFSHTYCPRCLRVWRMEGGLPPATEENGSGGLPLEDPVMNSPCESR